MERVFQKLREHKLYANGDKCKFPQSKIVFLDHVMTCSKVKPYDYKVEMIKR